MERNDIRQTTRDLRNLAVETGRLVGAAALYVPTAAAGGALELADRLIGKVRNTAPSTKDSAPATRYEDRTFDELYDLATERDIDGRSQMNKAELIDALRAEREDGIVERVTDAARDASAKVREELDLNGTNTPYEERTLDELRSLAADRDIEGRSTMNKSELIAQLRA